MCAISVRSVGLFVLLLGNPVPAQEPVIISGETNRAAIEAKLPRWKQTADQATPDAEAARQLATAGKGIKVTVYLGTWCGDSRREVARLWKAIDLAGGKTALTIKYVGVDQELGGGGLEVPEDIEYVPTFIVSKGGRELGRVVESAPQGIERELVALATGAKRGVVTGQAGK